MVWCHRGRGRSKHEQPHLSSCSCKPPLNIINFKIGVKLFVKLEIGCEIGRSMLSQPHFSSCSSKPPFDIEYRLLKIEYKMFNLVFKPPQQHQWISFILEMVAHIDPFLVSQSLSTEWEGEQCLMLWEPILKFLKYCAGYGCYSMF